MKFLIILSSVLALAFGKPAEVLTPVLPSVVPVAHIAAPISSQYHSQDELGQYAYGYSHGLAAKNEVKTVDGVTRGAYSYVDSEGKLQSVEYSADGVNGFRVAASNLPVAPVLPEVPKPVMPVPVVDTPEVAEAKAKHLAALEDARVRSSIIHQVKSTGIPLVMERTEEIVDVSKPASVEIKSAPVVQSYSYGINSIYGVIPQPVISGYIEQPQISTYIAQPIHQTSLIPTTYIAQPIIGGLVGQSNIAPIPVVPTDLPEVVKARAEHLAAVEQAKARKV